MADATRVERAGTWAKLRDRKVVQWGLVYVAAAWGFLQGLAYVSDSFHWPEQLRQIALLALLIGLPIVLVLAWYHGDRGQQRVSGTELAVLALLFLAGGFVFWRYQQTTQTARVATPPASMESVKPIVEDKSIAVLPFVNMSSDKEQEYFSDGISEELLNLLTKVPQLRVTSRSSAFSLKGQNLEIREIARRLNVTHVLEGSVRKSGNRARITAQLIDARSDMHLWAETYDRPLDDIFAVQDEIAGEVVKALKLTLLGTTSVTHSKPVDPEAYNLVLEGRFFLDRRSRKDLEHAVDYFGQARDRDPGYAPAWAGLSQAYARRADSAFAPTAEGYRQAREAAEKALALDPQLGDAHLAMGWIQRAYDWDWEAADASSRRALELDPGSVEAIRYVSNLAWTLGHWREAIDLANKAIERDPLRPNSYTNLGRLLQAVNRVTEAEAAYRKALELDPGGASLHMRIGTALLLQGKTDAGLEEMQRETEEVGRLSGLALAFHALGRRSESDAALAALKDKYAENSAYQIAEVHAFRGEADLAFEWLERAYVQRDAGLTGIKGDPLIRGLAGDPRYKAFLKKMKLPE